MCAILGTRYLLVGFVEADRYKRNTWYRRFGMCSSCVRFSQFNASAAANETEKKAVGGAKKTPTRADRVWGDGQSEGTAGLWDWSGR